MIFHDDASAEKVTADTVETLKSAADQIGKSDRAYSNDQIVAIRNAVEQLSKMLSFKERKMPAGPKG